MILGGVVAALLLLLAMFPWGLLRGRVETALTDALGAPVSIGAMERQSLFSWVPVLTLRDVRAAQPAWAGDGDLARLDRVDIRLNTLALLRGRVDATPLTIDGGALALVRDADGRTNWPGGDGTDEEEDADAGPDLSRFTVRNVTLSYRDGKQRRRAVLRLSVGTDGIRAAGRGDVNGRAVTITVAGGPIAAAGPWPFEARLSGTALSMLATGTMAAPLDTGAMAFDVDARADSLDTLDRIIEAGLFGTQPIALRAHVVRDDPRWIVERMSGTVGRSRIASIDLTVRQGDRTRIDGSIRFASLDFNDLSDDAGLARGRALTRAIGERIVPNTRLNLANLAAIDGALAFRIDRVLGSEPFRRVSARITLDDSRLAARDLTAILSRGRMTGSLVVDQRGGRSSPRMTFDLTLSGSSIAAFAGGAPIDAPLDGRLELVGTGDTIRAAVGASSGRIGLYAGNGTLPPRIAAILGGDIGRGALGSDDGTAQLRCVGLRLAVDGGRGRIDPLLIDTSRSQTNGTGTINLSGERLALSVRGRPKQRTALHLDDPITIGGTLSAPAVRLPERASSVGGVLGMVGDAITGNQAPLAGNADCTQLRTRIMR